MWACVKDCVIFRFILLFLLFLRWFLIVFGCPESSGLDFDFVFCYFRDEEVAGLVSLRLPSSSVISPSRLVSSRGFAAQLATVVSTGRFLA